jgi:hypothetical protein
MVNFQLGGMCETQKNKVKNKIFSLIKTFL